MADRSKVAPGKSFLGEGCMDDKRAGTGRSAELAQELVSVLTTSVESQLEADAMRKLKQLARLSSEATRRVFDAVMAAVRKKHSQVRLLCLLIMDALFMRSRVFRRLVVSSLPALLPLLLGYQPGSPLPAPQDRAELLKRTALECLKRWELAFGAHPQYVQLLLAKRYVERSLRMLLPDLRERASRQERERRERRERTQALLGAKFESLRLDFPQSAADIRATVNQVELCLELVGGVGTRPGDRQPGDFLVGEELPQLGSKMLSTAAEQAVRSHVFQQEAGGQEPGGQEVGGPEAGGQEARGEEAATWEGATGKDCFEEAPQGSLRSQIRQAAMDSAEREERDVRLARTLAEMPNVLHTLSDLFRVVDKRFLPLTAAWIATLSRFEDLSRERVQERDDLLKAAIDLRSSLKRVHARCTAAGLVPASMDASTSGAGGQARSAASAVGVAAGDALGPAQGPEAGSGPGPLGAHGARDECVEGDEGDGIEWEGDAAPFDATMNAAPSGATIDGAGAQQLRQMGSHALTQTLDGAPPWKPAGAPESTTCSLARDAEKPEQGVGSGCHATVEARFVGGPLGQVQSHGPPYPDPGILREEELEEGGLGPEAQRKHARRQQLLSLAPRLPWGQHLDYWDAGATGVPVNSRGMSFENHWGPVDETVCLPQERVRELALMVTTYKPPVASQPSASQPPGSQPPASKAGQPQRMRAAGGIRCDARSTSHAGHGSSVGGSGRPQSAVMEGARAQSAGVEGAGCMLPAKKLERRAKTAASIRSHNDSVLAAAASPGALWDSVTPAHGASGSPSLRKPSTGAALKAMLKAPTTSASRLAARAREAGKRRRSGSECDAARDMSVNQW